MTTIFATDFHGTGNPFIKKINYMLNKYPEAEIVFGGDYIDGRLDTKRLLNYIRQLQNDNSRKVTVLKGNHEELMMDFIKHADNDEYQYYYHNWISNGGNTTIKSLFGRHFRYHKAKESLVNYQLYDGTNLIDWVNNLKLSYVNDDGIFAHAFIGVNHYHSVEEALKHTRNDDKLWNRLFIDNLAHNLTNKSLFIGHTPTCFFADMLLINQGQLHVTPYMSIINKYQDNSCPIIEYHYDNESSIVGCDGGCHGKGKYNTGNVVVIDKNKIIDFLN